MKVFSRYVGSPTTVVFFTGNKDQRDDDKNFEWTKTAESIGVNSVFIMDDDFLWYQTCIDDVKEYIDSNLVGNVFTVGSSSGGYAALLFGYMYGFPSLSFAPQTILSERHLNLYKLSDRIKESIAACKNKKFLDLSYIIGPEHEIHYCRQHDNDRFFAERMNVTLVPHKRATHVVARKLRDDGKLRDVIDRFIKRNLNG